MAKKRPTRKKSGVESANFSVSDCNVKTEEADNDPAKDQFTPPKIFVVVGDQQGKRLAAINALCTAVSDLALLLRESQVQVNISDCQVTNATTGISINVQDGL